MLRVWGESAGEFTSQPWRSLTNSSKAFGSGENLNHEQTMFQAVIEQIWGLGHFSDLRRISGSEGQRRRYAGTNSVRRYVG